MTLPSSEQLPHSVDNAVRQILVDPRHLNLQGASRNQLHESDFLRIVAVEQFERIETSEQDLRSYRYLVTGLYIPKKLASTPLLVSAIQRLRRMPWAMMAVSFSPNTLWTRSRAVCVSTPSNVAVLGSENVTATAAGSPTSCSGSSGTSCLSGSSMSKLR